MALLTINGNYRDLSKRYLPRDKTNLKYFGIYGLDAELTRRNHLDGSTVTMTGAPVINPAYARFTNLVNFLNTGVSETAESTFVAVVRVPVADVLNVMGNYNSGTAGGTGVPATARGTNFTCTTAGGVTDRVNIMFSSSAISNGTDVDVSATLTSFNINQWYCIAGTIDAAGNRTIYDLTGDRVATTPSTLVKNLGLGKINVGSAIVGNSGKVVELAAAVIYDKAKTKTQLLSLQSDLRKVLQPYGISI